MLDEDAKGKVTTSTFPEDLTDAQDPTIDIDEEYNQLIEHHY